MPSLVHRSSCYCQPARVLPLALPRFSLAITTHPTLGRAQESHGEGPQMAWSNASLESSLPSSLAGVDGRDTHTLHVPSPVPDGLPTPTSTPIHRSL